MTKALHAAGLPAGGTMEELTQLAVATVGMAFPICNATRRVEGIPDVLQAAKAGGRIGDWKLTVGQNLPGQGGGEE